MAEYDDLFENLLFLGVFMGALWFAGELCKLFKMSSFVGMIIAGILLGPNALDFVPLFDNEVKDGVGTHTVAPTFAPTFSPTVTDFNGSLPEIPIETAEVDDATNFLIILGEIGVTFLIFESGLHVDFKTLKEKGFPAFMVAVNGTIFSIGLGLVLSVAVGFDAYPEALAIGAIIGPTSVGLALKLLFDANCLDSEFGQIIVTAAFTDDIFSLVTLAVLLQLASGELTAWGIISPFVYCGVFIFGVFGIAVYLVPIYFPPVFDAVANRYGQRARDVFHLTSMFLVMALFGYCGDKVGSHLLGAFLTGVLFNKVPRTHHVWESAMTDIMNWLVILFFGATVGFAVPVDKLLSFEVFWKGMVVGVGTLLGKIFAGIHLKKKWVVGWAMVGRGEFSFLVGAIYIVTPDGDTGNFMLSEKGFGVAVWALLLAIFAAPLGFGWILSINLKRDAAEAALKEEEEARGRGGITSMRSIANFRSVMFGDQKYQAPRSEWYVTVATKYQEGLVRDLMNVFSEDKIHVKSYVNEGDMEMTLMTFVVLIPDPSEKTRASKAQGIKMHPSVAEMKGDKAPEVLEFEDTFMQFDIDKYVDRLRQRLQTATNGGASTVTIERYENNVILPGENEKDLDVFVKADEAEPDRDSAASSQRNGSEDENDI